MRTDTHWLRISAHGLERCEGWLPLSWLRGDVDGAAFLVRVNASDVSAFDESLCSELLQGTEGPMMFFLVSPLTPGPHRGTYGPPITSFACSLGLVRQYVEQGRLRDDAIPYVDQVLPQTLDIDCYPLTTYLMDVVQPLPGMRAIQLPYRTSATQPPMRPVAVEWVVSHTGHPDGLEACLASLRSIAPDTGVRVVSDQADSGCARPPTIDFLQVSSELDTAGRFGKALQESSAEYLLQQGSDEISCVDRLPALLAHREAHGLDIVSSHEISVDDGARQVQAVRRAIDLDIGMPPHKPFLFGFNNALMKRTACLDAGGLSPEPSPFAEAGLLYRAVLKGLRIGGVNAFLLIRRRRMEAANGAPLPQAQQAIMQRWARDFDSCRKAGLRVEDAAFSSPRTTAHETAAPKALQARPHDEGPEIQP
ncbi:MAG: hypothetical protein QM776_13550 [Rhodocyclaceae bacterium]